MTRHTAIEGAIAQVVKDLVQRHGLSLRDVSRGVGWTPDYLSQVLRGAQDLKIEHLRKVFEHLGEHPARFFARVAYGLMDRKSGFVVSLRDFDETDRPSIAADMDFIESRLREEAGKDREALEAERRRGLRALIAEVVREELGRRKTNGE